MEDKQWSVFVHVECFSISYHKQTKYPMEELESRSSGRSPGNNQAKLTPLWDQFLHLW